MEIPTEVIDAKDELEGPLFAAGLVTGVDIGIRDEEAMDPEDLALRIYVADVNAVPDEVSAFAEQVPFPAVVMQLVFEPTQGTLPDFDSYRPVKGGCAVSAARFSAVDDIPTGTLGAVVRDPFDADRLYGLSNFHVLANDSARAQGDEIAQPPGTAFNRIGTLDNWAFPETTFEGRTDAAVCLLDRPPEPLFEVAEVGAVSGVADARIGQMVGKRGAFSGLTFGVVTALEGSYSGNHPGLAAVAMADGTLTTRRLLKKQTLIRADFPQFVEFGRSGDSGAVVLDASNRAVGLYWGSGFDPAAAFGDPTIYGVASPASFVAADLSVVF